MSTDAAVTKDLIQTLEDGKDGFAKGAQKLEEKSPDLAAVFRRRGEERAKFLTELEEIAKSYGDEIKESGTATAALHRGWLTLKDALAGSGAAGVLDAAEQGEDHAVKEYEKALAQDISPTLHAVVERQFGSVKAAHDEVSALKHAQK